MGGLSSVKLRRWKATLFCVAHLGVGGGQREVFPRGVCSYLAFPSSLTLVLTPFFSFPPLLLTPFSVPQGKQARNSPNCTHTFYQYMFLYIRKKQEELNIEFFFHWRICPLHSSEKGGCVPIDVLSAEASSQREVERTKREKEGAPLISAPRFSGGAPPPPPKKKKKEEEK